MIQRAADLRWRERFVSEDRPDNPDRAAKVNRS